MTTENTEGPRSFTRFLEQVADGDLHNEASERLRRLIMELQVQARAQGKANGELILKLRFKCEGDIVATAFELIAKEPKPRRAGSIFFVTRGGNLSIDNQRQHKLPLQEVKTPKDDPKEVATPEAAKEMS